MLELTIRHGDQNLLLELPLPTEVITGELRNIGLWQSLHLLTQDKFALQPTNKLGEHFMKLVQPDDTLRSIAMYCKEFDVLARESRQALEDLVMADRFRDLDHMGDYLQHGTLETHAEETPHVAELEKPDCPLIGQDGNVFNLIGVAARTLREHGLADQAKEMRKRAMDCDSYDQALGVITEYVNPTSVHDDIEDNEGWYYDEEVYEELDFGGMGE